jgi:gliding motility-associated-like protein
MGKWVYGILFLLFSLFSTKAEASHIVGGDISYKFLGDTVADGLTVHKYEITLYIYQDCQNGQPEAIQQDNPAFLSVFDGAGNYVYVDTNIYFSQDLQVPANFSNSCVTNVPPTCLRRKTFVKVYYLQANSTGYLVAYQRCCRNATIMNIKSPGDRGSTYFCKIPPMFAINNSASFKNYPPQIICINTPLYYDNSATDIDGDSLSYEFCDALLGASDADIKPIPKPPTSPAPDYYTPVDYIPPYTAQSPLIGFPAIKIDPNNGIITGTPNRLGRFLVTICCHEWRGGQIINTVRREFQFVVTDCSKAVIADIPILSTSPNTYIVNCENHTVHFINNSKGGFSYTWDFGVEGSIGDVSTDFEPTYTYPDTGTYTVKLVVNPGTTCPDSIRRFVKVYPTFDAIFDKNGPQCPGSPIQFHDQSSSFIKPVTSWKWYFGDGDSSSSQNPQHSYGQGGTYNIMFIAANIKNCTDTAVSELVIQNFKPSAGKDTFIVKGEHIEFNGHGGINYLWTPSYNLSDTTIFNPVGQFPDTGRYIYSLFVQSAYGCSGYDTIKVTVVNNASFFVPTAFTPNGDGLNDFFRPVSVGYAGLKYFRVFNRWGQDVYVSESLETGWNGTLNGVMAEMGVYYWVIRYVDRFGVEGVVKGDVTLLR